MTAPDDASRTDVEGTGGWLTAAQVAEALGVKRETVYAYVSRGILHRRLALDGRTSLFDRRQIEDLRRGGRGASTGELRTVLATGITRVAEGSLIVRGHELVGLVEAGAGFEAVADLIWEADNPELWGVAAVEAERASASMAVVTPGNLSVLDRFRIAVTVAAAADPLRGDLTPAVVRRTARRLVLALAASLPVVDDAAVGPSDPPDDDEPPMIVARLLWPRLTAQDPDGPRLRALDVALALMADHGLATSTFAVRVAASVRADPYASVGAGLGALDGPLHGAASGQVHRSLATVAAGDDAAGLRDRGPTPVSIPGFGHTVYRSQDPRFAALYAAVERAWTGDPRLGVLDDYRRTVGARTEAAANADLALGLLTWMAEMSPEAGEAIFAVSRCAGWIGHAMEEYQERPLRLRPRGHYVGPLPIDRRQSG